MDKINYRKDQKPIIDYTGGTMAVPAVPGAGKTFIVTNLVAKLLVENRDSKGKILVLTYMNSAANNFKGRIKGILQEKGIESSAGFDVMTIHSLAVQIIKEKPDAVMLSEEFDIADELQKNIILKDCISNFRYSYNGDAAFRYFLKDAKNINTYEQNLSKWEDGFFAMVSSAISSLKYKDVTPKKLKEVVQANLDKKLLKIISVIYSDYDKALKENGLLDYDDLLIYAYRALSNDEKLREKFQKRYSYVFEDECQDSNEIQGKIIKLICEKHNNLVRVGDVNQSITGTFSASDPKFFKAFMNEADYCYKMNMSNRSSRDILNLANNLVEYVCSHLNQVESRDALQYINIEPVESGQGYKENPKPEKYQISSIWYDNFEDEVQACVKYTRGIKKKYPDKSIGILVPYNSQVSQVAAVLEKEGLEFEELGPNSKNKRRVIDSIAKILDFLVDCDDLNKLIEVLSDVFIKTDNKEGKMDFINMLRQYDVDELLYTDLKDKPIIIDDKSEMYLSFKEGLDSLVKILDYDTTRVDRLILFIKDKIELEEVEKAIVDYIAFYVKYLLNDNPNITIEDIISILKNKSNNVFKFIIEVVYELNGYEPGPGSITVCNYHKSKGMEWDCVFLLQLTQYNFPDNVGQSFQCDKYYLKDKYKNIEALIKSNIDFVLNQSVSKNYQIQTKINIINEKIRLLYVGITRAKEMLILSGSTFKSKNNNGKFPQEKCIYFKELSKIIEKEKEKI